MDIDLWQSRYPLPGAKTVIHRTCFALNHADYQYILLDQGLATPDETALFANMMQAVNQPNLQQTHDNAWHTAKKILLLTRHYTPEQSPAPQDITQQGTQVAQSHHPADLLTGKQKAQAWQQLATYLL